MISGAEALAAMGIGLAGAGHCLGMCGGIASMLSLGSDGGLRIPLAYQGGRLLSYAALGGALGWLAGSIDLAAGTLALRYLAGFLLIAMGLSIAEWWRGISLLERAGARLWRPVQRLSSRFLPVRRPTQAAALGLCWGLMPCGLIYSALAWSATAQDPARSALLMFLFGVGTLPAMLTTALGAAQVQAFLRRRGLKLVIGLALIASGIWSLYLVQNHRGHILSLELPVPGAVQEQPATMDHSGHHGHH